MAAFSYIAKDKESNTRRGVVKAESKDEALKILQTRQFYVIAITAVKEEEEKLVSQQAQVRRFARSRIKLEDLALLARQLATLLSSGVPLLRSLEVVSLQCESKKLESILRRMINDVREGLSLTESIAKYRRVFSSLWRGLIDTGESSGNLAEVLERLAEYLELRQEFLRRLISAIIYPLILLGAGIAALLVFTFVILPKFQEIFKEAGIELPVLTKFIFDTTNFVTAHIWLVLVVVAGIFFGIQYFLRQEKGKILIDKLKLKVPLLKDFFRIFYLEKFSSTAFILFQSGVPIVYALDVIQRSMNNSIIEKVLDEVKNKVKVGESLSSELSKSGFFPPLVIEMTAIGEEVGNFPEMFSKISHHYRVALQTKIERATSFFEPVMILCMGFGIGILVIALFLPLFQVSQAYR